MQNPNASISASMEDATEKNHLNNRLAAARSKQDEAIEKRVLEIIRLEKERSSWRRRKHAMNKPRGRSARVVQATDEDGSVVEFSDQVTVEDAIWNRIHSKRFFNGESAPICKGTLR